ncbi:MarR family winged helix-turn-helix transcriptional regulator [Pyrobaculum aerophilum]|uniref:MarR family transcriptional regulator n=1 Tax=Pyrobaculum aerophilum TaxID=13773 RepID=A0A371R271_9CREN|nr:MarR family transcriptional regulator [Pyrobaculum aerophilum]RFA97587.1 MarR family transcriptional regulator [Pyrobaculum aerophilum]RFA99342.1 MarR family transcriptional regulator [Pyrobaculum aerophilum]
MISDVLDRLLRAYRHMLIEKAISMGLTELQLSALLVAAEGVNTVVKLADRLMVAQPTATDTLLALEKKGFITRHRVGKTTVIKLTDKGVKAVEEVKSLFAEIDGIAQKIGGLELRLKLLELIAELQKRGLIEAKLCLTCRFFEEGFCKLLGKKLSVLELRAYCLDYQPAFTTRPL